MIVFAGLLIFAIAIAIMCGLALLITLTVGLMKEMFKEFDFNFNKKENAKK